jgi:hypothetical protein
MWWVIIFAVAAFFYIWMIASRSYRKRVHEFLERAGEAEGVKERKRTAFMKGQRPYRK